MADRRRCWPANMLWRCAAYNPHSAWQTIRKEEIASAFSGYHALGLCGTKVRRLSHEPSCCTSRVGTFRLYEWGHAGKSEHAAGVAIYLRDKVFAEHNVKQIYDIPADFQGRLGILRVKRGDVDFAFIVVYPWVQARTIQEQQRIRRLWAYVGSVVSALPYRCVPIMFTDANAKNGLRKGRDWQPIDSPSIGPCTPEVENASGLVFHNMLEQQFLCSANSFMGQVTRILATLPVSSPGSITSASHKACLPMLRHAPCCTLVGAKLQRIFGAGKRDHVPVNLVFRHASSFSGDKAKSSCKWDRSLLANGVLRGDCRRDLVNGIVRKCRATDIPRLATGTGSLPTPSACLETNPVCGLGFCIQFIQATTAQIAVADRPQVGVAVDVAAAVVDVPVGVAVDVAADVAEVPVGPD